MLDFFTLCLAESKEEVIPKYVNNVFLYINNNEFEWFQYKVSFENYLYFVIYGNQLLNIDTPNRDNVISLFTHPNIKNSCLMLKSNIEDKNYYQFYTENKNTLTDELNIKIVQPLGMVRWYNKDYEFLKVSPQCAGLKGDDFNKCFKYNKYFNKDTKSVDFIIKFQDEAPPATGGAKTYAEHVFNSNDINSGETFVFYIGDIVISYNKIGVYEELLTYNKNDKKIQLFIKGIAKIQDNSQSIVVDNANAKTVLCVQIDQFNDPQYTAVKDDYFKTTNSWKINSYVIEKKDKDFVLKENDKVKMIMPSIKDMKYFPNEFVRNIDDKPISFIYKDGQFMAK